jgi:hypothetical protein
MVNSNYSTRLSHFGGDNILCFPLDKETLSKMIRKEDEKMTIEECKFPPYPSGGIAGIMLNYRHDQNLTQKELAEILDMPEDRVRDIEEGRIPSISMETHTYIVSKIC